MYPLLLLLQCLKSDHHLCFIVQAALCWCMAVQECAMCLSWPDSALRHWATERGEAGQLLFRGPRCVGVGVCSDVWGLPSCMSGAALSRSIKPALSHIE